jgi:hypothetical protein
MIEFSGGIFRGRQMIDDDAGWTAVQVFSHGAKKVANYPKTSTTNFTFFNIASVTTKHNLY